VDWVVWINSLSLGLRTTRKARQNILKSVLKEKETYKASEKEDSEEENQDHQTYP
jgi:hypothetical protein